MPKYLTQLPPILTYNEGRECKNCREPIADQVHATRTHCPKTYDDFGNVIDCKTKLARINDKPERDLQRNYINAQKFITGQIKSLIEKKGHEVGTDDLTAYDINLRDSIKYHIKPDGTLTSWFLKHRIISNPITNLHKIDTYE